jgi:PEP-CTERM motif-containing protein
MTRGLSPRQSCVFPSDHSASILHSVRHRSLIRQELTEREGMSHKRFVIGVMSSALSLCLATGAHAAVIFSDNFDAEALGLNATLDNWTVSDGTIDVVGPDTYPGLCDPPSGSSPSPARCIDLDGSTSNAGTITSAPINFAPGTYDFLFSAAGNQRGYPFDTLHISIGSLFGTSGTFDSGYPWLNYSFPFIVTSPTTASIVFALDGGDNVGVLLDDVSIRSVDVQAVPEPASLTLLGSGVLALIARRRRMNKR